MKKIKKTVRRTVKDHMPNTKVTNTSNEDNTIKADKKNVGKIELKELIDKLYEAYAPNGTDELKKESTLILRKYMIQEMQRFECYKNYNLLILFDRTRMVKSDADSIYSAVTSFTEKKPLILVLLSRGGVIGSAFLIGKLCREYSNGLFKISVPRAAKSEATLLCCAADEIHMGSLSELGPIDPQIDGMPVLGLKNSIEHIAQLVKQTPESSDMFAKYLTSAIKPIDLGYYERVAESSEQYAEKLLDTHNANLPRASSAIAYDLVYTYKDHGFIFDKTEATKIFGDKIIRTDTEEYFLGDTIYRIMSTLESLAEFMGYSFYFIGSIDSEPNFKKRNQ